ncbi:MAG: Trigger factor [Parcubacteria group bacterium GW2011_GWA1_47_8]|nr:MAG: Trigger factor [Parcubacteria group bacterium GW2011_GWA1_47_8]
MTDINTTLKNVSDSEVEITCEIAATAFEKNRTKAVQKIAEEISLPGFRRGHVPEKTLVQKFGEIFILEEMANLAIDHAYPAIIEKHKVHSIGMPSVAIKKLAKGNPFEFTLTFPVMPEIKLPDYKKIAHGIMEIEEVTIVEDEDVTKAVDEVRKQFATKDAEDREVLPELTEEFIAKFGDFKTVEEFTAKVRESLTQEKTNRAREKKRAETMEKIADGITVSLPRILVEGELERMVAHFRKDIERMGMNPVRGREGSQRASTSNGMKFEEYLTSTKKSLEDLRKEWEQDAEKRVKVQLALNEIATIEKLKVPSEDLEREVTYLLEHVKGADPATARIHVENLMMNEEVFKFLEGQK